MTEHLMRGFYLAGFRRAAIMYAMIDNQNKGISRKEADSPKNINYPEIEENGVIMWEANKERLIKNWCPMEKILDEFNPVKSLLEREKEND